jgi:hypothetical protein
MDYQSEIIETFGHAMQDAVIGHASEVCAEWQGVYASFNDWMLVVYENELGGYMVDLMGPNVVEEGPLVKDFDSVYDAIGYSIAQYLRITHS